jgi:hypothetical protein
MDSDTDLHSTITNFSAIATFITKHATQSELWKMVDALHSVWLHPDGRVWLSHHLSSHKYIVTAIVLQFQHVVGLYVKIANSLEYRRAVKDGKQIDPLAYETANRQARHIIATMNNMIPGMTLGPFVIEPVACGLFHPKDRVAKDKRQPDKKLKATQRPPAPWVASKVVPEADAATMVALLPVTTPAPIPGLLTLRPTCPRHGSLH